MILVDIYVPSVDETYDFMLDEDTLVGKIIQEIGEMVCKKVQNKALDISESDGFMLYNVDERIRLEDTRTLYSSGIRDGSRLMLV